MRINRLYAFLLVFATMTASVIGISLSAEAAGPKCEAIDGNYIITFTKDVAVEREVKSAPGKSISPKFVYKNALNGFAATLSAEQVCAFQKRPNIESIELDSPVTIGAVTTQNGATWGLDRIDQTSRPLSTNYNFTSTGTGVTAYVIDTGIFAHADFSTRLSTTGFTSIADGNGITDCNGHGTHVAGTIAGNNYGVAKGASLVAVRVLDCNGSGSMSGVAAGLDWVRANFVPGTKAVANMSLGGGVSSAVDSAVNNLIKAGVTVVVAAGNSSADACKSSPARVPAAITVAASDKSDLFASFSNKGTCVDIIAPGVAITSTWLAQRTNTISGTSMASPHVAGAVARYLGAGLTPAQLLTDSLSGVVKAPARTVSRFLYLNPTK